MFLFCHQFCLARPCNHLHVMAVEITFLQIIMNALGLPIRRARHMCPFVILFYHTHPVVFLSNQIIQECQASYLTKALNVMNSTVALIQQWWTPPPHKTPARQEWEMAPPNGEWAKVVRMWSKHHRTTRMPTSSPPMWSTPQWNPRSRHGRTSSNQWEQATAPLRTTSWWVTTSSCVEPHNGWLQLRKSKTPPTKLRSPPPYHPRSTHQCPEARAWMAAKPASIVSSFSKASPAKCKTNNGRPTKTMYLANNFFIDTPQLIEIHSLNHGSQHCQ